MSNPNHIAVSWLFYMDSVIPKDASPLQIQECKRAFYGGAYSLFKAITILPESPGAAVQRLEDIDEELESFKNKVGHSE